MESQLLQNATLLIFARSSLVVLSRTTLDTGAWVLWMPLSRVLCCALAALSHVAPSFARRGSMTAFQESSVQPDLRRSLMLS